MAHKERIMWLALVLVLVIAMALISRYAFFLGLDTALDFCTAVGGRITAVL